jgi:hypothetical protein
MPSFSAMSLASFGSSTILPTLPVKSIATRDRTDSCKQEGFFTREHVLASSHSWNLKISIKMSLTRHHAFPVARSDQNSLAWDISRTYACREYSLYLGNETICENLLATRESHIAHRETLDGRAIFAACSMILEINTSVGNPSMKASPFISGKRKLVLYERAWWRERAAVPGCRRTLLFGIRSAGGFQSGK